MPRLPIRAPSSGNAITWSLSATPASTSPAPPPSATPSRLTLRRLPTPLPNIDPLRGSMSARSAGWGWGRCLRAALPDRPEAVHAGDQRLADAGFHHRMAGVGDDLVRRLGPGAVQFVGGGDGTDQVIAP